MRILMLLLCGIAVAGCAPKYSCSNFPTGSCKNMSQVYGATGEGFVDYRDGQPTSESARKGKASGQSVVIGETAKALNDLQPGDPVLTKPKVLRAWIAPWEDKDSDLNYSYVYIRVKESEWTVLR